MVNCLSSVVQRPSTLAPRCIPGSSWNLVDVYLVFWLWLSCHWLVATVFSAAPWLQELWLTCLVLAWLCCPCVVVTFFLWVVVTVLVGCNCLVFGWLWRSFSWLVVTVLSSPWLVVNALSLDGWDSLIFGWLWLSLAGCYHVGFDCLVFGWL